MTNLAANFQKLLAENNITVSELARQVKISQPVLFRLAKGHTSNPKVDTIRPVANYFGVSVGQLLGDEQLPSMTVRKQMGRANFAELPFLTLTEIPQWLKTHHHSDQIETLKIWANMSDLAFAYKVDDATMQPRFPVGSIIALDPKQAYKDHDYVVAETPERDIPVFRQILRDGQDRLLKPLNSDFPIIKMNTNNKVLATMTELIIQYQDLRK